MDILRRLFPRGPEQPPTSRRARDDFQPPVNSFAKRPAENPDQTRHDWMGAAAAATAEDSGDSQPIQAQEAAPAPEAPEAMQRAEDELPFDPFEANADGQGPNGAWSSKKDAA